MAENAGFGLYVHWPFCQAKCPYCDFNSHVVKEIDQKRWKSAYLAEIARCAQETGPRVLNSIFFGGGTPSLMDADTVDAIIAAARAAWHPANDMEITLEANPTSVEAARFRDYFQAGVNRVSIGIQSLRDDDLRALGRLHSVAEARAAFEIARETFERVSFDLIYARQHQTLEGWRAELTEAISMAADHLSLYQLTIEDGTAFGDRASLGKLGGLPHEDLAADMYFLTQELTEAAGMPSYETSNHAVPGAESKHNLIYWRSGEWAGIGPGAHGRLNLNGTRIATETHLAPTQWLTAVEKTSDGESSRDAVSGEDADVERLLMGLRLREGVDLGALPGIYHNNIKELSEMKLVTTTNNRLATTEMGRPLLNAVLRQLLA